MLLERQGDHSFEKSVTGDFTIRDLGVDEG
jgi:hypothetical protein